jgi:hypothetical protein
LSRNDRQPKSSFVLEALEPRVLLSADPLLVSAVAACASAHKPIEAVHHESPAGPSTFHDSISYVPANAAGGIFEGVASRPVHSQPAAQETAPPTPSGPSQSDPAQAAGSAVQAKAQVESGVVSATASAKIPAAPQAIKATSASSSASTMTQQLTACLTAANGPPASTSVSQVSATQSASSSSSSSSGTKAPALSAPVSNIPAIGPADLLQSITSDLASIASGGSSSPINLGNASLAGVLSIQGIQLSFANLTISGGAVTAGTVTISATSASLTLGGAVTSTFGQITGSYDIAGKTFSLSLKSVNIAFSSFVNITADGASLTYNSSTSTTVNLTDGTNTSTKSVSVLTLGIDNASVFAGANGPASNSDAVGVSLSGANLALALMSAPDGTVYYK